MLFLNKSAKEIKKREKVVFKQARYQPNKSPNKTSHQQISKSSIHPKLFQDFQQKVESLKPHKLETPTALYFLLSRLKKQGKKLRKFGLSNEAIVKGPTFGYNTNIICFMQVPMRRKQLWYLTMATKGI